MKSFIHENFLLGNETAAGLYRRYAENKPVIDFHCHLSPAMIDEDRQFRNLTEAWLEGDHYKWRAMRSNGIPEQYCTGDADDLAKFMKWAETVPATVGNPLYHWTHLELARYFGINELLSPATAENIYSKASSLLTSGEYNVKSLIRRMNVEVICTTDDPADNLVYHQNLKKSFSTRVLPTFRPDNILKTSDPDGFKSYVNILEKASRCEIRNFETLITAIESRHSYFHENGCRLSDHGLERFYFSRFSHKEIDNIITKLLKGFTLNADETEKYNTALLLELCKMNSRRKWTQQFHIGAIRNNNRRMFNLMGPDTGWDSIGPVQDPVRAAQFLSELDNSGELAKTILYNLNPSDNAMMITMAGNFNDGSVAGKIQYGAAWWFLDQKTGMEKHLKDISYPRHEYFRRLLCNYIGEEIEKGLIPDEEELLKPLIEGVCFRNAKEYLELQ